MYQPWMLNVKNADKYVKQVREREALKVDIVDLMQLNPRHQYKVRLHLFKFSLANE
jgi:hypothetical protein